MTKLLVLISLMSTHLLALDLKVGEFKKWPFPEDVVLQVSRKGIIDVEPLEGKGWKIFALKKGVVTITPRRDGKDLAKLLVKVNKDTEGQRTSVWGKWAGILCHEEHVRCLDKVHTVRGVSSSWKWFSHARYLCRKKQPCLFDVSLSAEGITEARRYFSAYFDHVSVTRDGRVFISGLCTKGAKIPDMDKHLSPYVFKMCSHKPTSYTFRGNIYWLKYEEAEQLGLDPWGILGGNLLAVNTKKLYSFLEKNRKRVIAKPELKVVLGKRGSMRQGFDLVVATRDDESKILKGGVETEVYLKELIDNNILLSVSVELRLPGSTGNSFESARFSSEIWLPLSEEITLGQLSVNTNQERRAGIGIFSKVPIIAPLFRDDAHHQSEGRVFVNVRLDKFDFHEKG